MPFLPFLARSGRRRVISEEEPFYIFKYELGINPPTGNKTTHLANNFLIQRKVASMVGSLFLAVRRKECPNLLLPSLLHAVVVLGL